MRIAALDVGSNSFHLIVADVGTGGHINILDRSKEMVRLKFDLRAYAYEPAWTNLGAAYLAKDKNEEARQALEKAVEADPESAPAHYNLGLALERLDRKKDAEREYKEALSADPKHDDAKKALDRIKSKK